jgi:hypothetical protein
MEKLNTPSNFKVGQIWKDIELEEDVSLYLVIGVYESGLYATWLHNNRTFFHDYSMCSYDIYIRDVSSLEKELL